jgi:hypothetical protein
LYYHGHEKYDAVIHSTTPRTHIDTSLKVRGHHLLSYPSLLLSWEPLHGIPPFPFVLTAAAMFANLEWYLCSLEECLDRYCNPAIKIGHPTPCH